MAAVQRAILDCLGWLGYGQEEALPVRPPQQTAGMMTRAEPVTEQPRPRLISGVVGADMRDIALGPLNALRHIQPSNSAYRVSSVFLSSCLALLGWRIQASGVMHIPREGKMIFAMNHASNWDSIVVTFTLAQVSNFCKTNPLSFAAKQELFQIPGLAYLLTAMEQIPTGRQANPEAFLQEVKERLQTGQLGFFPEGSRTPDHHLHRLKTGMIRVAIDRWDEGGYPRGDTQLIPVGIIGLADGPPEWSTPRCCGRDIEVKFARPTTIDQLVASFKQIDALTLGDCFSEWSGADPENTLLRQLSEDQHPKSLLERKLNSDNSSEKQAARRILERWLAQKFAQILAQTSGQDYVGTYAKIYPKKSGANSHLKRD